MKAKLILMGVAILTMAYPWIGMPVQAETLTFNNCSTNNAGDVAIGEAQMEVDVTAYGNGQVLFTFFNRGPNASSIADVYFEDGTLLGIAGLIDEDDGVGGDPGVDFSQGASPGDLPAGNNCPGGAFQATAGFTADSDPPVQPNGVNPNESLGVIFDLQAGQTFADVLTDLRSGELRIGIHVQGYAGGGSESFVNNPLPPPDDTPPVCVLLNVNPGPPVTLNILTQDPGSGLSQINILRAVNATVTIPPFTPGTTAQVHVTATKNIPNRSSTVQLEVFDVEGNSIVCDPVISIQVRQAGRPVSTSISGTADGEEVIVINGEPGLTNLDIVVNGTSFRVTGLGDGEMTVIDVSSVVEYGSYATYELTARGQPGASAQVVIPVVED